jgi:membrane protease YdiL (CAAX protease family)
VTDILIYMPVVALVLVANAGLLSRGAVILTYVLLGVFNVFVFLSGLAFLNPQASFAFHTDLALPNERVIMFVGVCLMLTGIVSMLFLLRPVRNAVGRVLPISPSSPLDATALVLAVDLVGFSVLQLILLPFFWESFNETLVTPAALWKQGLAFLLVGFLSVGFLFRRDWKSTLERLGLTLPKGAHLAWVAGTVAVALLLNIVIQVLWEWVQPERFYEMQARLEQLFGEFGTTGGLLAVGVSAGAGEEVLFRGALQPRLGLWPTTFLFTIIHSYYGLTPGLLWIFALGLGLGILRQRLNTTSCILFHALYNGVSFLMGT